MVKITWNDREEALELCKRLKPLLGKRMDELWRAYQAEDFRQRQELLAYLHTLWEKYSGGLNAPFDVLPPPDERLMPITGVQAGIVRYLGKSYFPCKLTKEQLSRHVLIVGETGSGKTTLIHNLLLDTNIPFICFDLKQDYRCLARAKDIQVVRWEDLKGNPLAPPPNVHPDEWVSLFSEVFAGDVGLLYGSKNFLDSQVRELYRRYPSRRPKLSELRESLETLRIAPTRRLSSYVDVTHGRIQFLCNILKDALDTREFYPIDRFHSHTVLELDGLPKEVQDTLINIILTGIFKSRQKIGDRSPAKTLIVIDEAKRVFDANKERRPAEGIPTVSILASQVREYGISLIIADQEPTKLTNSIISNSATKIMFTLGRNQDGIEMARAMNLNETSLHLSLPVGCCIIKHPSVPEPFIIQIPEPRIEKTISQSELVLRGAYKGFSAVARLDDSVSTEEKGYPAIDNKDKPATRFLKDLARYPLDPVTVRYDRLGLSRRRGSELRDWLKKANLIDEARITHPDGLLVWLYLTKDGGEMIREPFHASNEGPVHRFWKLVMMNRFRALGCLVEEEVCLINNHRCDILIDKVLAIEIETGKSNMLKNIDDCLDAGLSQGVISACADSHVASILKESLSSYPKTKLDRIRVTVCRLERKKSPDVFL